MSELPVRDTRKPLSPRTEAILSLVQALFPVVASIATAVWIVNGYFDSKVKDQEQRETEFSKQEQVAELKIRDLRKAYDERQLAIFVDTAKAVGQLTTLDLRDPEWKTARARFYQLYWSELAMVQNTDIEEAMFRLEQSLRYFESTGDREPLTTKAFCLAGKLQSAIAEEWSVPKHIGISVHYNHAADHCLDNVPAAKEASK